jgi:site-specific recombinase XerD
MQIIASCSIQAGTKATYNSHLRKMARFATELNIDINQVPSEAELCSYLCAFANSSGAGSLSAWMSAISKYYETFFESPLPRNERFRNTMKTLKRVKASKNEPKVATCLTRKRLDRLHKAADLNDWLDARNTVISEVMYSALLRFCEMRVLTLSDISTNEDGLVVLTIRKSKKNIHAVKITLSRTASDHMKAWIGCLPLHSHLLFPSSRGALTVMISLDDFNKQLKAWARKAGFPEEVALRCTSHGFRSGRATDLFNTDSSVLRIMIFGRWKSDSFLRYIRPDILVSQTDSWTDSEGTLWIRDS